MFVLVHKCIAFLYVFLRYLIGSRVLVSPVISPLDSPYSTPAQSKALQDLKEPTVERVSAALTEPEVKTNLNSILISTPDNYPMSLS